MDVRQASFSPVAAAALSTISATSTVCVGGALVCVAAGAPDGAAGANVGDAPAACAEPWPKIALMIFPKTLMTFLRLFALEVRLLRYRSMNRPSISFGVRS